MNNNNTGQGRTKSQYTESAKILLVSIVGFVVIVLISLIK